MGLLFALKEPKRGETENIIAADKIGPMDSILSILARPMVLILIFTFAGANFVAAIFLAWMPSYLNRKFGMSLTMAGLNGTFWLQVASIFGVICGGILADHFSRRHPGGRMFTQCVGLILGIPF